MRKMRYWTGRFLIVFGFIWLFTEPAGLFFKHIPEFGWAGYLCILILSAVVTAVVFWPKRRASAHFPESNTTIEVLNSDILDQKGSVIIAVSDTFDTEIGDIISKDSLIGQLLLVQYNGDSTRADADIEKALEGKKGREDSSKNFGKLYRFPIGTVAPILCGDTTYFLLALNKMMSKEKRVETDLKKIGSALDFVWESVRSNGNHQPIHIPLVGTRFGRSGLTPMFVSQLIVSSYLVASRTEQVGPSLSIHVHSSSATTFDFDSTQKWLDSLKNPAG